MIQLKPGTVVMLREDGIVRVTSPGDEALEYAAHTQEARDYLRALNLSADEQTKCRRIYSRVSL